MEDQQIIALFHQRSEHAIEELSKKYGALCMQLACNIVGNAHDAEECVNDAYLALWNSIPPKEPDPLCAYLCAVVRNISMNRYDHNHAAKRNSPYTIAIHELEGCIPSPRSTEEEIEAKHIAHSIDLFLKTLDKRSRVLFVRRYWYGEPIAALAIRFGTSRHMISVRLFRIREKLKKHLRKEGVHI